MKTCYFLPCSSLRTAPSTGEAAKLTNDVTEITSYFSVTFTISIFWQKFFPQFGRITIQWSNPEG
jgi:hypothetical protein